MTVQANLPDLQLISLMKEGDQVAFTAIYERYAKILLDSAYKRLDSIEEAEEIVQEIFISLYLRRKELEIQSTLEGYLKNALKYKVLNLFRTKISRERYAIIMRKQADFDDKDPENLIQAKQLAEQIRLSTLKLPKKCREVFLLSKVENLSNKEIAMRLNITVSAVEQHITKGLKLLREDLQGYDQNLILVLLFISSKFF